MPQLGETVTEGTVLRWCKQVGERIAVDEALLEVSTDKVDAEVPSPVAGEIVEILVAEGDTVPIGARLAVITESADDHGVGERPGCTATVSGPADTPVSAASASPGSAARDPRTPAVAVPDRDISERDVSAPRRPRPSPRSCRSPTSESERPRT